MRGLRSHPRGKGPDGARIRRAQMDTGRALGQNSTMETPDRTLDALGLKCPLPVLRAARTLRAMDTGAVLTVLADDPVAVIDIPHFCFEAGHQLLSQSDANGVQTYVIRRG